jgi:ribosomal protein S11
LFYLYLTASVNNIFAHLVVPENVLYPSMLSSAFSTESSYYITTLNTFKKIMKSKKTEAEYLHDFAMCIVNYLKDYNISTVVVVFKNLNQPFQYRPQYKINLNKIRKYVLYKLLNHNIILNGILDFTAVPFNGCKSKKLRRRRIQNTPKPKRTTYVYSPQNFS